MANFQVEVTWANRKYDGTYMPVSGRARYVITTNTSVKEFDTFMDAIRYQQNVKNKYNFIEGKFINNKTHTISKF